MPRAGCKARVQYSALFIVPNIYLYRMIPIVLMSKVVTPEIVERAVPDAEVRRATNRRALVEALLDRSVPCGAIVQVENFGADQRAFFESTVRHFPMLPLVVVCPDSKRSFCSDALDCIDDSLPPQQIEQRISAAFQGKPDMDRRRNNRFEWPIRARFTDGDGTTHEVSEISAGGAFLEPHGPIGERDTERTIELIFQNFTITTTCRILDTRFVSSRKANGFRISFTSLSEHAREFIDRVIDDAIVMLLLDPTEKPQIPTIEEDDLVLEFSSEIALVK